MYDPPKILKAPNFSTNTMLSHKKALKEYLKSDEEKNFQY